MPLQMVQIVWAALRQEASLLLQGLLVGKGLTQEDLASGMIELPRLAVQTNMPEVVEGQGLGLVRHISGHAPDQGFACSSMQHKPVASGYFRGCSMCIWLLHDHAKHASSMSRACCLTVQLLTLRILMQVGHLALQVLADEQGSKWPARIAVSPSRYLLEHMGESLQSCSVQAHSLSWCRSPPISVVQLGWTILHCCQPYTKHCAQSEPLCCTAGRYLSLHNLKAGDSLGIIRRQDESMSIVLNPVRANIGSGPDLEVSCCAWLAGQEKLGLHAQSEVMQTYVLHSHAMCPKSGHACLFCAGNTAARSLQDWHVLVTSL